MTNSPTPEGEPRPTANRHRRRLWVRVGLGVGAVAFVGGVIGARQAWLFINNDLAPLIEQNLGQTLNRPINLGEVEQVSLGGLVFGPSELPPTATDRDEVTLEAIEVEFNLLELLWTRTLRLSLNLINPVIFVDQDEEGAWITTQLQAEEGEGFIRTELNVVRIQNGTVVLEPAPQLTAESGEPAGFEETTKRQVTLQGVNGGANFSERNRRVAFDITTGLLTGGDLRLRGEANLNTEQTNLVVMGQNLSAADASSLLPLPLILQEGRLAANLEVRLLPDEPLAFQGVARFQDVSAIIVNVPNRFTQANGQLRFDGQVIALENVRARYGLIPAEASGTLHIQNGYNLAARVRSVSVNDLLKTFDLNLPIPASGALNADLRLTGALNEPLITGTASNNGIVRVDRINVSDVQTRFNLTPRALTFETINVTPTEGGSITGGGQLAFGDQGGLDFAFQARDLPGDAIARPYGVNSPNITLGRLAADVEVTGPTDNFQATVQWQAPNATYPGQGDIVITQGITRFENTRLSIAGGTATASAQIADGRWQAVVNAANIRLNEFSQELRGLFSGDLRLSGSLAQLNPAGVRAEGQVRFSEGVSLLERPLTAAITWNGDRILVRQATAPGFRADGFLLAQLQGAGAPALTGLNLNVNLQDYNVADLPIPVPQQFQLRGQADFNGRLTGSPAAPVVDGRLGLEQLAVNDLRFESPLRGTFSYAGGRGLNLNVAGSEDQLIARLDGTNRPTYFLVRQENELVAQQYGIEDGNLFAEGVGRGNTLNVVVRNLPLETLNLSGGAGFGEVRGLANGTFDINLANLNNPTVVGTVAIARPALGYINANTVRGQANEFTGQFRYEDGVATINRGEFRRGDSVYEIGTTRFRPGAAPQFESTINITNGNIQDILTAFQWFELEDLGRGIEAPTAYGAGVLDTVAIDTFGDTILNQLRRYSEIVALLEQQEEAEEAASNLPDLRDLQGSFTGSITVSSTPQTGLVADFNILGQEWTWTRYGIDCVIVDGELANGVLTLLPFRLQGLRYRNINPLSRNQSATPVSTTPDNATSGNATPGIVTPGGEPTAPAIPAACINQPGSAFLAFSGQIGGDQQNGQLQAQNVPVEALRDFFELPVDLTGNLNAIATLAGSQQNPQVDGEIRVTDATLNRTTVQEASTLFGYNNARLRFDGRVVVEEPQPLTFSGSIPYRFAFIDESINPGENIELNVDVEDEGLALLNLLTRRQLVWDGGGGDVELRVDGTLSQPRARGIAIFTNAQFSAQALPEPLTNVNGTIVFDTDRIQVETLRGQFSDGQVLAEGVLPIFRPISSNPPADGPAPPQPLTVSLTGLELNLKGIYDGGVNGQVILTGTALAPRIGGNITLSDGRVFLPDNSQAAVPSDTASPSETNQGLATVPPQLNNLRLTLGDRLLITREPILNFVAAGDLLINGTVGDLRPKGVIRLRSGQVNLFTTQFNLARGYDSRAIFNPSQGLDPFIDVRLSTSVIEVTRAPAVFQTAAPYAQSEIADVPVGDFGAFQTVRVQASVRGQASELFDNLELTSSPRRSENEIIALLGGSFINTLGQGDSTLAIANLAGSALLTNVQNIVGNALGLSEFRLFPTTTVDEDQASTFGLAAELGVDITDNLSTSVVQILTGDVPTQFNVRYRLSEEFLLRGSTNLSGDNRAVLEFERRF
ncbi:translocation/assembly module TamB domain-containing protein [Oscillatoria sp. FACHB-1407]|uniref:translocation/assembly module TamB domain-containing protein n=1 Tax=Oscillatoria sp. FACHB-1407 TaxID=2692847 RepID=UPI001687A922|nr:translocation/assembly module TamB [Oscillatoria sp. FACHB-1407]MBD2461042.1 translocation/assembly module TamB domain-containing protein [Oscillatoria sp. FACHB-1407]